MYETEPNTTLLKIIIDIARAKLGYLWLNP